MHLPTHCLNGTYIAVNVLGVISEVFELAQQDVVQLFEPENVLEADVHLRVAAVTEVAGTLRVGKGQERFFHQITDRHLLLDQINEPVYVDFRES